MSNNKNTLPEILTDSEFNNLMKFRLLNKTAIRDYKIRKKYQELRKEYSRQESYQMISLEYPMLSPDSIRKIIYKQN